MSNMNIGQVGIKMSHPINDEILENLFAQHWDKIKQKSPTLEDKYIDILAERAARAEFENRTGPHG